MESGRMNITEHEKGTMRMFAVRTGARDIVTIEGSVLGGYAMLPNTHDMVPRLASELFDAGTTSRSKEDIRNELSSRGISLSFSSGADRTHFHATCLPEDVSFVFTLIAECLGEARFPAKELSLQKVRTLAEIDETKTDTRALASSEFFRLIYDRTHVNYAPTLAEQAAHVRGTERKALQDFGALLGKGGLVLAVAGDVVPRDVLKKAERAFGALSVGTLAPTTKLPNKIKPVSKESKIMVKDKANVDVFLGAHIPITRDHPLFIPLCVLVDMLGGRGLSGGHLMRTIRERDGLTYGINAGLVGFGGNADGAVRIWATFSPATYTKALAATKKEIKIFLASGITEEALFAKKGEMTGKYAVGLGTSSGIAGALHAIGVEGKPLSYLEEYTDLIQLVTIADLNEAAKLVPWNTFSTAAAGTFE